MAKVVQALAATLREMVIKGVSTRKVSQLAEEMLGVEVSASRCRTW